MKRLFLLLLIFSFKLASSQQVVVTVDGYIKVLPQKKDTVFVEKVVLKDTVIYKDKIVYVDKIVYKDTTIYRDTCTTQPPPPPPSGIDYLALPISQPLDLSGKSNIIVEGKRFVNTNTVSIKLYSGANNITIRNCFFDGSVAELVELENATNITIENCLFARGLSGVYAVGSTNVKVINCQFVNMRARYVNGQFAGRGNFIQFNTCSALEVSGCKGENFEGESDPEDQISFYNSSNGVAKNNMFRGGGPSTSGGGILVGDNGGTNITVENNKILNPGNYIYGIAGGTNMVVRNNQGYQEQKAWSNVGGYAYSATATCSSATFTGNNLYATSKTGGPNHYYFPGGSEGCSSSNISGNTSTITKTSLGVPSHLITFVTPEQLLKIRK